MKQKLIHLSVLSALTTLTGTAVAATSVDLYGTINVAIEKRGDSSITMKSQDYQHASKLGIKGREDLGNGYAAIFKLEAQLNPDVGSGTYGSTGSEFGFNRESWVGLLTPVGAVRFGRSTAPLVNMWIGGGFSTGRGIGEFTGGLVGAGLRTPHPEAASRWSNALFYDVKKGGFAAGAAITTKGSQSPVPTGFFAGSATLDTSINNEGKPDTKSAWGLYARYEGSSGLHGYKVGAAYQRDNGSTYSSVLTSTNAPAESKDAYALAAGYSYGSVGFTLGYAKSSIDNSMLPLSQTVPTATGGTITIPYALRTGSSKTLFAALDYKITPKDKVYISYGNYKRDNKYNFGKAPLVGLPLTGEGSVEGTQYTIGYEHALSKRTVIYANARKVGNITNECSTKMNGSNLASVHPFYIGTCGQAKSRVDAVLNTEKDYSYDIGISHSF